MARADLRQSDGEEEDGEEAEQQPGSWWNDWFNWLAGHSGERQPAVAHIGNDQYPPLEPAPGSFVKQ